ncbi:hypothetical protein RRF57_008443 [Xylaria bambusicola]|uniref:Uncharacterized protein n=1 Tax=Xylaria bambusicola TaxID=326684 RepID=A0AAN7UXW8_9PEZI
MSTSIFLISFLHAVALGAPTTQHLTLLPGNLTTPANSTLKSAEQDAGGEGSPQNPEFSTDALIGIVLGGTVGIALIVWGINRIAQRKRVEQ